MMIKVLFFGATADAVGGRSIQFDIQNGMTAEQAFAEVVSAYPRLRSHKLLFALNEEYVDGTRPVNPGDELAVFTAVSGG